MTKHSISDSVQFSGEWFLPGFDARSVAGTLAWSSRRAQLQLYDPIEADERVLVDDELKTYPAVHGETIDSKLVTMLEASTAGKTLCFGAAGTRCPERLASSWVVVGAHVDAQTRYCEIRARIPGLEIWLSRSGVRQRLHDRTSSSATRVIYEIEGLREEVFDAPAIWGILGWGVDGSFSGNLVSDISVRMSACLRIQAMEPRDLSWFFAQLGKATTLLSFVAGAPMAPDHISAKISESDVSVEVLVALREPDCCTYRRHNEFYMCRGDMQADLGEVFARWLDRYERIDMPSRLALSVLSSKESRLHVEFLSLMQALEGFHRATMSGLYTTETEYEHVHDELVKAIPATVSPDHRAALKSRIKYGNEVSLRKRLDALVDRLPVQIRKRILGGAGRIPQSWVATRNYYTHWDQGSRESVLDGLDMHRAGVRLKHLLRVLYLDYVGIPHAAIEAALGNACRESQYLAQLNSVERSRQRDGKVIPSISADVRDSVDPDEPSSASTSA